MTTRLSLRDYQRQLAARLSSAESGKVASKLALQVGGESWLIDLAEAGEVIPVPHITPVPLTRPWFKGVVNVRGNLYNVVDFAAFLGGAAVTINEHSRLLLLAEGLLMRSALLVDRSLGLRDVKELDLEGEATTGTPWVRAQYVDKEDKRWKELDVRQLVQHAAFLSVAA
jgi:twitching motility protein PilI